MAKAHGALGVAHIWADDGERSTGGHLPQKWYHLWNDACAGLWTVGDLALPRDKQDHVVWSAGCPGFPNYVAKPAASGLRTLNPLCLTLTLHIRHKNEDKAAVDAVIPGPRGRGGRGLSKVFLSSPCRREGRVPEKGQVGVNSPFDCRT